MKDEGTADFWRYGALWGGPYRRVIRGTGDPRYREGRCRLARGRGGGGGGRLLDNCGLGGGGILMGCYR
jgi:hypothetical protein